YRLILRHPSHSFLRLPFAIPRRIPSQTLGRLGIRSFPFRTQSESTAFRPFRSIREYCRAFRGGSVGIDIACTLYPRPLPHRLTLRQAESRRKIGRASCRERV